MISVAPTADESDRFPLEKRASLSEVVARVQRMDSTVQPGSSAFEAGVLLQAALHIGHNVDRLSRFTGIRREVVARCARRLVDNGVWHAGNTIAAWTDSPEEADAFRADVAVAEGKLCRRVAEDGQLEWAPQGYWRKHYEYVGPKGVSAETVCYHPHVEPIQQDFPYIVVEDEEQEESPAEEPAPVGGWLSEAPEEPLAEPVWLGQSEPAEAPEQVPAAVGGETLQMFPDAVWLS
jgi:hypothetical protein